MDIMATTASSQRLPFYGGGRGELLPFYSRYHTAGSSGIDVLDVGRMLSSTDSYFGYCFSPPEMVGLVPAHLRECRARSVIEIPAVRLSWFLLVAPIGNFGVGPITPGC